MSSGFRKVTLRLMTVRGTSGCEASTVLKGRLEMAVTSSWKAYMHRKEKASLCLFFQTPTRMRLTENNRKAASNADPTA